VEWRIMKELTEAGEFEFEYWWRPGWIPFLANGGGDNLCLDLEGSFNGRVGQVLEFWHIDTDRTVLYPSLDNYLETVVSSLESGAWPENEEFWPTSHEHIARLNPGYPIRFLVDKHA
jgi:cell wall assembly regulator SMI1